MKTSYEWSVSSSFMLGISPVTYEQNVSFIIGPYKKKVVTSYDLAKDTTRHAMGEIYS